MANLEFFTDAPDGSDDRSKARFGYIAVNAKGESFRGELEAVDHHNLVVQLQQQGLFLVKWAAVGEQPVPTQHIQAPPTRPRIASKPLWLLIGAFVAVIVLLKTFWGDPLPTRPSWPSQAIIQKIHSVHVGMKRSEVEKLFIPSTLPQSKKRVTRYKELPGVYIDIAYQVSDVPHPDDAVTGVVSVSPIP